MEKIPGVASVRVSLNQGLTVLDLRPDNRVTVTRLREVIKNSGFVSKEVAITARGTLMLRDGTLELNVSGTHETFALAADAQAPAAYDEARRLAADAAEVRIDGELEAPGGPARLIVRRVKN